jgi:hypothetical protein
MTTNERSSPPRIRLAGEFDHPDFGKALELLRASAQITDSPDELPELTIVAQARPDAISGQKIESLRCEVPPARIVALLGNWCEGETRTGRPWPGVQRFYWYEFPAWWRRQLSLRAAGCCTDWTDDCGLQNRVGEISTVVNYGSLECERQNREWESRGRPCGYLVLSTPVRDTALALSDFLQPAGYATVWSPAGRRPGLICGATAAIWEGGQLSTREADELAAFCRELTRDAAPVIALLDFPRYDRCELAREVGAAAILGKPWRNAEVLATLEALIMHGACDGEPSLTHAA